MGSFGKRIGIVVVLLLCVSVGMTGIVIENSNCEIPTDYIVTNKGTNDILFVLIVTHNETDSWLYVTPTIYRQYSLNDTYVDVICRNDYLRPDTIRGITFLEPR